MRFQRNPKWVGGKRKPRRSRVSRLQFWKLAGVSTNDLKLHVKQMKRQDRIEYLLHIHRLYTMLSRLGGYDHDTERFKASVIRKFQKLWGKEFADTVTVKGFKTRVWNEIQHLIDEATARNFRRVLNYRFKIEKPPFRLIEELQALRDLDFEEASKKDLPPLNPGIVIASSPGFKWVMLEGAGDGIDADYLDTCGNAGDTAPNHRLLSLRYMDKKTKRENVALQFVLHGWTQLEFRKLDVNHPTITGVIPVQGWLGEMKGRSNSRPLPKYHEAIAALLKSGYVLFLLGGGYKPRSNFEIEDLSRELREEVYKAQPHLTTGVRHLYSLTPDDKKPLFLSKLYADAQGNDPTMVFGQAKDLVKLSADGKQVQHVDYPEEQFFHMIRHEQGISALNDLWERYVRHGMENYEPPAIQKDDLPQFLSDIRSSYPDVASAWKRWKDSGDEEAEETLKRAWYDGWQFGTEIVALKLLEGGLEKIGATWDRFNGKIQVFEDIENFLDRCERALFNREAISELDFLWRNQRKDKFWTEETFWPRDGFDSMFDFEGAVNSLRDQMPRTFTPMPKAKCQCGREFWSIPRDARTHVDNAQPEMSGKYFECDVCKSTVFEPKHGYLKSKNPGKRRK